MKIGDIEVESVKVLSLQPDDILVVLSGQQISQEEAERVKASLITRFGITNKILIMYGAEFEVIRREQA